ncbi:hypothetical protein [Enorma sp.]|uniref:hypothetical protein n=1 Tax=Enorma sp. TaxID=1920692 RepID=UPI0025B9A236|nr:hypothetical protein [Enorma sp.]
MAASVTTSRAIYAGLSCGFAFAVPVCAYAVTLPFPQANGIVAGCAMPFTVGALAGVGLVTALSAVADHRSGDADLEDTAAVEEEHAPSHRAARSHGKREARAQHAQDGDVERFFGKRGVPRDVPVIARAAGAPSEAAAWADIDALFDDDSPISCDASRSKDIYQIAFEELRRGAVHAERPAGSAAATGRMTPMSARPVVAAAHTPHVAAPPTATPAARHAHAPAASAAASTAMFMALAQQRAAAHAAEGAAQATGHAVAQPSAPSYGLRAETSAYTVRDMGYDRDADARAALASLDRFGGQRLATPAASAPAASAAAAQPSFAAPAAMTPAAPAQDAFADRRDVWSAALDILAESEAPVRVATSGSHGVAFNQNPSRANAIAEGRRANRMHAHVNELIEQELGQIASPAVRRSSREYLRVIQGGTASMPALQAEA